MTPNPALGVFFHWLGGLASGSFYVPFRGVKRWSWETYWLVGGVFSWIIAPWFLLGSDQVSRLPCWPTPPVKLIFWCFFFGLLWGVGGLTFGLTMRYLGLSLGMAIVMGLLRRVRHPDAAHLQRHLRTQVSWNDFRARDPDRHCVVSRGDCHCGPGGRQKETHDVSRSATSRPFRNSI